MELINCAIIDDEPLAREGLRNYIQEVEFLNLLDTFEQPLEFMSYQDRDLVDLLFLDIQMPKMSGMEFLRNIRPLPSIIVTTAHPSYALESFQWDVVDYLLKPITFDRFYKAASKVRDLIAVQSHKSHEKSESDDHFFIKCDSRYEKIYFSDILFIKGMKNYIQIITEKEKYLTLTSMKDILEHLPGEQFLRTHKSYIVNSEKVKTVQNHELVIQTHRIPVSRNMRDNILHSILKDKLLN